MIASTEVAPGVQLTELDEGIRVVTEEISSVRSVALGLWVRTGSRDETPEQAGVSHFLEHLLFKGTPEHDAIEINEIFDGLGASVNAATSNESTHLHARCLDNHAERAFAVLSQMLLKPTLPPDEVDSERQVILEEIAMYEDEPGEIVHDLLGAAVFPGHPLGRPVIGTGEVIAGIPVEDIGRYHDERYRGPRIVIAAAGNIGHEKMVELAREHVSAGGSDTDGRPAPFDEEDSAGPQVRFRRKETEQYNLCLGSPGIARDDDRRFTLRLLNTAFGGSTSSRLFREVRERRGLAYSVGSYSQEYIDRGLIGIFVGTRCEKIGEATEIIAAELARLAADGITGTELARAKESIKGRLVLGLESTAGRMSRIATSTLYGVELLSIDDTLARIDSVTEADVAELAAELFRPELFSASAVGPDEAAIRTALEPVSAELAAAA